MVAATKDLLGLLAVTAFEVVLECLRAWINSGYVTNMLEIDVRLDR